MSMDIFSDLLTGSGSNHISAELLETLGNQAARRYLEDGDGLNETIRELVAQHPEMKNEHTKRIAEFANNQVFQELHTKSDDKNIHFAVADPGVIIRDLKDGGSPNHDGKTLSVGSEKESDLPSHGGEYRRPPGDEMSPSTEQGFADLDSAFLEHSRQDQNSGIEGTGEQVAKTAAASLAVDHSLHANPIDNVYAVHVRLRASKEKLAEAHETFDLLYKAAEEDYFQAAKQEVIGHGGSGMAGVIQATKLAAPSDIVAFKALRKVAERMVDEGIPSVTLLKTAAVDEMLLNPEHPLVQAFSGLMKLAKERARSALALADVRGGLEKTGAFLRSVA